MKLYHGSNMEVAHPRIRKKLRALDFGAGFYLTSSKKQAEKWARAVTRRRQRGTNECMAWLTILNHKSH
jgi:hypothetical protein